MNRATMLTMLKRRVNDQYGGYWDDDSYLCSMLNTAALEIQKEVLKYNPLAFLSLYRVDITAGESFYPKPEGMWWEKEVGVKLPSDSDYTPMERLPWSLVRNRTSGNPVYSGDGTFFLIKPTPAETLTLGLQVLFTPILTMSEDTDVLPLHLGLHLAVVIKANQLLLAEVPETPAREAVMAELADQISSIPIVYRGGNVHSDRIYLDEQLLGRG
jgi:hypothetical protein